MVAVAGEQRPSLKIIKIIAIKLIQLCMICVTALLFVIAFVMDCDI